jgi:peptidyl-prolyl cis-trans isomerase C
MGLIIDGARPVRARGLRALLPLVAALALSCGQPEPAPVTGPLVELDSWSAGTAELVDYRAKLPASLQPGGTDEEIIRSLLASLVDRQIMIAEGEALGYHEEEEFTQRQFRLLSKRLVEMLSQRFVSPNVQVSDAEVEEMYRTYHWDREILPAHILSATEEDAREVIRLLDQGGDFAEIARDRSIAPDAAEGGFLGQYFGPNDAVPELVEAAHGLPIGEYTREPVRTRDGWEVVKVLDATPVPLDEVRPQLMRGIYMGKFVEERNELVDELWQKFGVSVHDDGLDLLIDAGAAQQEATGAATSEPAITFAGDHTLTVGDVQRFVAQDPRVRGDNADSAAVIGILRVRVLSDSLLHHEARAAGLDTLPEFRAYRDNLYRRMIVTFLRKKEVLEQISVTEEEIRQEYEAGIASGELGFCKPDQIDAREILVETRAEAEQVARRLRQGEDASALARDLSKRPDAVRTGGHIHVTAGDAEAWGPHYETLWAASDGDIVAPLQRTDGFSVVAIDRVQKDHVRTYEEMRLGMTHRKRLAQSYRSFESYIDDLRQMYADRVVWHDDRIAALAQRPPWAEATP